jgi:bifunctional non-homologous end joining protein LigD
MAKAKTNPRSQSPGKSTKANAAALGVEEFLALKQPKGDLTVEVEGQQVSLTSLDRVYWSDEKLTKFDLLCYYLRVGDQLMPFLKNRPAILQRWPRGVNAPMFFQQDLTNPPPFIKTVHLTNQEGRELDYAVFTTTASLLYFVNLGTIEQHPWNSTVAKLDKPDWIAIDLDPKQASWQHVLEVALITKSVCDELGLEAFPKTSGSSGIHIYVPLKPTAGYDRVAEIANLLAGEVTQRVPQIATLQRALVKRKKEQVYVDWMQNARGKSLAAVLTARAKPKATVSMPLTWKQIEQGVKISDFTVKNVPALLKKSGNPWADFFDSRQKLKLK